jgi:hypothetical protein
MSEALEPPAAAPQCSDFSETVIQGSPARQGPRGTESRCTEWTDCRSAMSSARYLSRLAKSTAHVATSESAVSSGRSISGNHSS